MPTCFERPALRAIRLGRLRFSVVQAWKVMRIQDFVLIEGFASAPSNPAKPAPETLRAAAAMNEQDESELKAQLARLRQEHRDLDAAIEALHNAPGSDLLQVQRLKKRKLVLKDQITAIEDQLLPDIIA